MFDGSGNDDGMRMDVEYDVWKMKRLIKIQISFHCFFFSLEKNDILLNIIPSVPAQHTSSECQLLASLHTTHARTRLCFSYFEMIISIVLCTQ